MATKSSKASASNVNGHRGLVLRAVRPDGQSDEIYLKHQLSIGRGLANALMLVDDESVAQVHARVDFLAEGSARLRCLSPDSPIFIADQPVTEVALEPGVRFQIGKTTFECLPSQSSPTDTAKPAHPHCPYCGTVDIPATFEVVCPCNQCGAAVFPLDLGDHPPTLEVLPAQFGPYRAEQFIARGMSLVLRGVDENSGLAVAIKVLLPDTTSTKLAAERFQQEISLLAQLDHPRLVKLLGSGQVERFAYLVMEWIEGQSLRQIIGAAKTRNGCTHFAVGVQWLRETCEVLAAIHTQGIVHRDVKPSNLLIDGTGHVRLLDLGIAKSQSHHQQGLTTTGQMPGTYDYMAPEQFGAVDSVDWRTDQYSLGITFYELLTGARPVGAWPAASAVNPTVPPWFDDVLRRLLSPSIQDRFESDHTLLAAINDACEKLGAAGHESLPRWPMVVAGALVGAIVAVGASYSFQVDLWIAGLIGVAAGALIGQFTVPNDS